MKKIIALCIFALCCYSLTHAQIITTVAGGGSSGLGDGGQATACELNRPSGTAVDAAGNLYIADRENNRVRKVTTLGVVSTIAGTGIAGYTGDGGPATLAKLNGPFAIAIGTSGDIYFSEADNYCVRKINSLGVINTIAGTGTSGFNGDGIQATVAQLGGPGGIAIDNGENIYIAEFDNNRIRKVNTSGIISTIAGTGTPGYSGDNAAALTATLKQPVGLNFDALGNLYITEFGNNCIRKVNLSGTISTIAGGTLGFSGDAGPATAAKMNGPLGVCVSSSGYIYFSDSYNHRIRMINPTGIISTIAGTGSSGFGGDGGNVMTASFYRPLGVTIDALNNIYIADWGNDRIRTFKSLVSIADVSSVEDKVSIFPNPNNGNFTLNILSPISEEFKVVMTNIVGQVIGRYDIKPNQPANIRLDVPTGTYIISVATPVGVCSEKINII